MFHKEAVSPGLKKEKCEMSSEHPVISERGRYERQTVLVFKRETEENSAGQRKTWEQPKDNNCNGLKHIKYV